MAVSVQKMLFTTIEEKNDVYQRSTVLNPTADDINNLRDLLDRTPSGEISPTAIAATAPGMVGISDTPFQKALISGGWCTQRLAGIVIVAAQVPTNPDIWIRSYLMVYSDPTDLSYSGIIDENVTLHINKVLNVKEIHSGEGVVSHTIHSAFDVLVNNIDGGVRYVEDVDTLKLLRPIDVITGLSEREMHRNNMQYGDDTAFINVSSRHDDVPMGSDVMNAIGVGHVSKVLNGIVSGDRAMIGNDVYGDRYANAAATVIDPNMSSVPIIRELSRAMGTSLTSTFTLATLARINNGSMPTPDLNVFRDTTHTLMQDSESTLTVSLNISIGVELLTSISALMCKLFITSLNISIAPDPMDASNHLVVLNSVETVIEHIDSMALIDTIMFQIKNTILPTVAKSGTISINGDLIIDVSYGHMLIAINGGIVVPVTLPEYASSVYSPNISNSEVQSSTITSYGNLSDMVLH